MKTVKLFFKTVLCSTLPLCLLGGSLSVAAYSGSAPQQKAAGTNLRVMSYNVLVDNDEDLGGWSWGKPLADRGDKASACIAYYQPDVIGFQECNYKWHVSLKENLKDYAFVNADVPEEQYLEKTESLGKKDWMCTTMMYNTKTLKLIKNELVGYSCNYWGCIQRMRYASIAVFEIKATGERFTFISTHLDAEQQEKGQQMRMTQTDELSECIQRYKSTYGYPVIVTGDFNSKFDDAPIQNVARKAGLTASANNRGGIDYVLYSAGVQSKYFTVVGDADVLPASDHKPIFADMLVEKYTFPTTQKTQATTTTTTQPESYDPQGPAVVNKPTKGQAETTPQSQGDKTTKTTAPTTGGNVPNNTTSTNDGTSVTQPTDADVETEVTTEAQGETQPTDGEVPEAPTEAAASSQFCLVGLFTGLFALIEKGFLWLVGLFS